MKLNVREKKVLNKIADKTKMDCWFCLFEDKEKNVKVRDLENRKTISLKTGVKQLNEGIVSYDLCRMTVNEIEIYENLLCKLEIPVPKERHIEHIIECCERLLAMSYEMEYEGIDTIIHEIKATAEIIKGED